MQTREWATGRDTLSQTSPPTHPASCRPCDWEDEPLVGADVDSQLQTFQKTHRSVRCVLVRRVVAGQRGFGPVSDRTTVCKRPIRSLFGLPGVGESLLCTLQEQLQPRNPPETIPPTLPLRTAHWENNIQHRSPTSTLLLLLLLHILLLLLLLLLALKLHRRAILHRNSFSPSSSFPFYFSPPHPPFF